MIKDKIAKEYGYKKRGFKEEFVGKKNVSKYSPKTGEIVLEVLHIL